MRCGVPSLPLEMLLLGIALALDRLVGEPPSPVHPVVWMGAVTERLERLAPRAGRARQLAWGAAIALFVPLLFAAPTSALASQLERWPLAAALVVGGPLLKTTFASRALGEAARRMRRALAAGSIADARRALGSLCSRDPSDLDEPALVAATVESVAENASDSLVAPLFYYALFGLPGAMAYRAVNTLDAMIGYHGRTEYLGKAAARLDDLLNLVPARLTAALLLAAGALLRRDVRRALRTLARDGARTESPNAGRPMAVMAGLLGVELAKQGHYRLGDAVEPLTVDKIDDAWRLVQLASVLAVGLSSLLLGARHAWT